MANPLDTAERGIPSTTRALINTIWNILLESLLSKFLAPRFSRFPIALLFGRWNSQPLTLDDLQVVDYLFDALYLPGNRSSARLLRGGLDFAG